MKSSTQQTALDSHGHGGLPRLQRHMSEDDKDYSLAEEMELIGQDKVYSAAGLKIRKICTTVLLSPSLRMG